jgi:hypothetical protein
MTVVAAPSNPAVPSLFDLVKRVRREVTKETLVTLNDDVLNNVVIDAINDATADIYNRTRWNWAKTQAGIVWIANQSEYPLPPDFRQLATELAINAMTLKEVSLEEWYRNTYTPSWNANSSMSGQPMMYMVDMQKLKVWPTPSADFVASMPNSPMIYYRKPSRRLVLADTANTPDVPNEFIEALHRFGVGMLKMFLEFTDFQKELDRYETIILNRIQTEIVSAHPSRVRPRNWRTTNYG